MPSTTCFAFFFFFPRKLSRSTLPNPTVFKVNQVQGSHCPSSPSQSGSAEKSPFSTNTRGDASGFQRALRGTTTRRRKKKKKAREKKKNQPLLLLLRWWLLLPLLSGGRPVPAAGPRPPPVFIHPLRSAPLRARRSAARRGGPGQGGSSAAGGCPPTARGDPELQR